MPTDIEDYIHRIGRTGRRGRTGTSISYIDESETTAKFAKSLVQMLDDAGQDVPKSVRKLASSNLRDVKRAKERYRNLQGSSTNQYQNMDKYRYGSYNARSNYQQNDRYNSYERNNNRSYGNNTNSYGHPQRNNNRSRNNDFHDDFD